jgi:hypothetical protein
MIEVKPIAAATLLTRTADAVGTAIRGRSCRRTDSQDISTIWDPKHVIKITKSRSCLQAKSRHSLTTVLAILDAGENFISKVANLNAELDRQAIRIREPK